MMLANSFFLIVLLLKIVGKSLSLVISEPPIGVHVSKWKQRTPSETKKPTTTEPIAVRIRSTQESDLDEISSLLACTNLQISPEQSLNWKESAELLRNKATLRSLLFHRYQAIMEGKKQSSKLLHCSVGGEWAQSMWARASFRNKIRKAASMSNEQHMWKEYNFSRTPDDARLLQHKMMTARDVCSGSVVGFCEIAMLSPPSERDDVDEKCDTEECCAPTIMNLVISPKCRRRGLASGLLESAVRFTTHAWSRNSDLGLYVDEANIGALRLYSKHGFKKEALTNKQWYMSRPLTAT